jgi:hypothetical protein
MADGALMAWCSGYRGSKMETQLSGGESDQGGDDFFIAVEGGSRAVRGGWLAVVVRFNASVLPREGRRRTKHCRKMKRRQRAHLGSIGRKHDMERGNGNVG